MGGACLPSVIDLRNQEAEAQLLQENNQPSFGWLGSHLEFALLPEDNSDPCYGDSLRQLSFLRY
jgi:hypothetical protein